MTSNTSECMNLSLDTHSSFPLPLASQSLSHQQCLHAPALFFSTDTRKLFVYTAEIRITRLYGYNIASDL